MSQQKLQIQSNHMRELLKNMSSSSDRWSDLDEEGERAEAQKGTVKQALSRLDGFFPQEAPVPKFFMLGPPRRETFSKETMNSYMLSSNER